MTKCRKFAKSSPKTVEKIKSSKIFENSDIEYILNCDELPDYVCSSCWNKITRNPENFEPGLPLVEWHKSQKTRKYDEHLTVTELQHLEPSLNSCPKICKILYERLPNLFRGAPNEAQNRSMCLKAEIEEKNKELEKQEKKQKKSLPKTRSSLPEKPDSTTAESVICKKCYTEIGRGKSHKCGVRRTVANLFEIANRTSVAQPLACKIIDQEIGKNKVNGELRGPNNKPYSVTTKRLRTVDISPEDCINAMRANKLSKKTLKSFIAFGRKLDPNGLSSVCTFKQINQALDERMAGLVSTKWDFFECKLTTLETSNLTACLATGVIKKGEIRNKKQIYLRKSELTYVNDLEALYRRIVFFRKLPGDPPIAWKIDDGKKSFKIMWQVINLDDINFCSPDTLQVIAELPKIPETTRTVHEILNIIGFDSFCSKFKNLLTVDFKMYAILLNIKGTSARHPCIYNAFRQKIDGKNAALPRALTQQRRLFDLQQTITLTSLPPVAEVSTKGRDDTPAASVAVATH